MSIYLKNTSHALLSVFAAAALAACGNDGEKPNPSTADLVATDLGPADAALQGTLGAACSQASPCSGELECISEACEVPSCPSGTLGCPCAPGPDCRDPDGSDVVCGASGLCERPGCTAGSLGCACDGEACGADLSCVGAICRFSAPVLVVSGEGVRGCDVLLAEAGPYVRGVRFEATVVGEVIRQAPHTGVSFIARADSPLAGPIGWIYSDAPLPAATLSISQAACHDRAGRLIPTAEVNFQ